VAAIHVFAIDWVPEATDIASGGGLRSRQIIDALREAGHTVTFSVPAECRHLRRVGPDSPAVRYIEVHTPTNQLDVLRKTRPDIVLWLPPLMRTIPFTGSGDLIHVCDLIGLQHIEASLGTPAVVASLRERLARLCSHADLVLTGSEEQNGYWLAELSRTHIPPPTVVVPYALPDALRSSGASGKSTLCRLHVTGMVYPWSTSTRLLERVANWVAERNDISLSLILGTDPGGATDRSVLHKLQALAAKPHVEMPGEVSFADAMADYRAGSLALDLYEPNMERRLAVPIRTVNALTQGVPILSTVDGTLMCRLQAEGAGVIGDDRPGQPIEYVLDRIAALSAPDFGRLAKNARAFAQREFGTQTASKALVAAIEESIDRRNAKRRAIESGFRFGFASASAAGISAANSRSAASLEAKPPHVLVISNVEPHHRELRIDVPFNALFGHGKLSGYTVWSRGDFSFTTSSKLSDQSFDAIWVQREISPDVAVALHTLGRPFVYDIDDNLLASPGYRPPFSIELTQTVRNLIWTCSILSCSTARLGQLLNVASLTQLIDKVIVTPNLLRESPAPRPVGAARFLIWVSSDTPALTRSRLVVIKAIRDFCLAHDLKLACIGAEPPDLIAESDVDVVHVRQVPYGSYLSLLRSFAPGIMACPLESDADTGTADFIQAKSDIKMLEALACGLVGVFSRAYPYLESNLPQPILRENTYSAWMEGLAQAWQRCAQATDQPAIPPSRCANATGAQPWLDAIKLVRLPFAMPSSQFKDAVSQLRGRYGKQLLSEAEFDARYYLATYSDIDEAIDQGRLAGPYAHYLAFGYREGRLGRPEDALEPHNEQVWANLIHTLGDLRTAVTNQGDQLASLKVRRATRLKLR
jgi:hypothetical protein